MFKNELDITIVVTCYNEGAYIADTLDTIVAAFQELHLSYEIIVIDDCSKDNSSALVSDYIKTHPNFPVRLVTNARNKGLAVNYVEGAFLGKGKYYRLCCGDNPEPKDALVNIFQYTGKASIIIPYQCEVAGKPWWRRQVSKSYTALINSLSGYNIKYYNGSAIHLRYNILRWHPSSYGFGFQADILNMLLDQGTDYMQVPTWAIEQKGGGASAINTRNFLSVCHTIFELAIRRLRRSIYGRSAPEPLEQFPDSRCLARMPMLTGR